MRSKYYLHKEWLVEGLMIAGYNSFSEQKSKWKVVHDCLEFPYVFSFKKNRKGTCVCTFLKLHRYDDDRAHAAIL